ncbi:chemotaxis-specific protein-glutamate methyltransferase CheB [Candidatus Moduliflexota bacterium]
MKKTDDGRKIRVLIAEDSIFTQKLLVKILETDPAIEVIGVAKNGRDAVDLVRELRPDLVTMDIRMPVMDGFRATQLIMSENPTPILVISSSVSGEDLKISFNAIQAGALDIVEKPQGSLQSDYREIGGEIIRRVKMISEIKVFRHLSPHLRKEVPWMSGEGAEGVVDRAVVIGASTGGPSALHRILQNVPEGLPASMFVTQHISEGFGEGCVEWLAKSTQLKVKVAVEGERIVPGAVYFAPDRGLLEVASSKRITIREARSKEERLNIDVMMKSVASSFGSRSVGILLTGMGSDGVEGLRRIKAVGGSTIVQDEETSIVFGMPRAAIEGGVADMVLPLDEIMPAVVTLLAAKGNRPR